MDHTDTTAYRDVLCAVDGSRASRAAVGQAVALAGPAGQVHFVAVRHEYGSGPSEQAGLSEMSARNVLADASSSAERAGVECSVALIRNGETSKALLDESAKHTLIVLGSHSGSRLGGIVLGSTATEVSHRSRGNVLIARRTPNGNGFPRRVLLATNGSSESWAAARVAIQLARVKQGDLRFVYVPDGMHQERYRQIQQQVEVAEQAMGSRPEMVDTPGHVAQRICEAAATEHASLIVVGHRSMDALRALGSVSERVAHRAPCSVLMVAEVTEE